MPGEIVAETGVVWRPTSSEITTSPGGYSVAGTLSWLAQLDGTDRRVSAPTSERLAASSESRAELRRALPGDPAGLGSSRRSRRCSPAGGAGHPPHRRGRCRLLAAAARGSYDLDEVQSESPRPTRSRWRDAPRASEGLFSGPSTGAEPRSRLLGWPRRLGPGSAGRHDSQVDSGPEVPRRHPVPAGARLTGAATLSDTVPTMTTPPTRPST